MRGPKDRVDWQILDSPATAGVMLIIMMFVTGYLMVGCAAPIEGVVVGKDYDAGRNENYQTTERRACGTETYTQTSGTGTQQRTVTKTRQKWCSNQVTKTRWVPADWDITVRTDDGKEHEVDVSQAVYDRIRKGDRVNTGNLSADPRTGPVR